MSIRGRAVHSILNRFSPGARLQSQLLPTTPGDLVILGDGLSLHGEWAEWFPGSTVRVLGDELLLLEDAGAYLTQITAPRALVLLVGSADLLGMGGSSTPERAAARLDALVARATSQFDPSSVFVVGVPSRPAMASRARGFNRRAASLVAGRGATFVAPGSFDGVSADGYMVSPLRWDATVYTQIAQALATATGLPAASARRVPPLTEVGDGFVVKMERKRAQLFEALPAPTGRLVLFGDSITEGGFWDGWLPGRPVTNRGIGGDTVAQLTARIDTAIDSPLAISVLAGTNDLVRGDPKDADSIGRRFETLIAQIREREPSAPLIINSVMPRGKKYIDAITTINTHYRRIAAQYDAHYLDLWPALATPDQTLRKEFTPDGLHLNGQGYRAWASVLKPALDRLL
ncbi:hypothetical protein B7R54_01990 [Subtercola boreus]|uniref:SGNH hydrolase-type esterase domain-containing protein n=1 Tax=Subtercola boreus TaxID=120213 RepID=A0A3E0VDZ1_9MICO|nr:GDSL-type esterase/lipase family protein [Subtercola boreus]RFA08122.1 hypothetical protein B7R54_01990 [Subtercola boreus]TQL54990.1 lysophospholipase L1-like esterase [Subtercola boreus]